MNRNYYVRNLFLIVAFATSQLIVLFAYRFLQISTFDTFFPAQNCPTIFEKEIALNESIAKEGIAMDAENEKSLNDTFNAENEIDESIIFIDELPENKVYYELDYTKSHPFENECRFPVLSHNDDEITKYVGHYREIDCSKRNKQAPLVNQYRNGEILIGRPHRSPINDFVCFYAEISGALAPRKTKVNIGKMKRLPLERRIFIQHDQYIIKCFSKNEEVYHNVFAWISEKPQLTPPSTNLPNKYSISLLIIDSTSRNQFFRHMPLTLKFMKEKDFQILYGYTKIGDNSAINLLGILAGMVYAKDGRGFKDLVEKDSDFDFIKFNKDFGQLPDTIISKANGSACNSGQNIIPKWINLWEQFETKYSNHCHFSFNFFTGLTHASANNLELYDIPVSDALARMEFKGILDNTFLLIMGDHGQRIASSYIEDI
uniref:Uncharacterized protein n=1 Tax=Panagrolaimus sp. PS1159 TaxID=55785 RepID=A0AC35F2V5_9BILA